MGSLLGEVKAFSIQLISKVLEFVFDVVFGIAYSGKSKSVPPIRDQLLLEPAVKLAVKIRQGKLKSENVVRAYINRIKEVQPYTNVVADERFEGALKDAREVDKLIQSKKMSEEKLAREKPFLGVPVTTKNSVGVKGMVQDAGLMCRKGTKAEEDAECMALMKKAGAIPICITNVPELCMWNECTSIAYGDTCNPYDTTRTCGGSSGGEGSLIGSAGSVFGIGTDIGGSIRIPAFCNGIFGHKTSPDIVSNHGMYPHFVDRLLQYCSAGPMCRYACDLIPMLRVLAGDNARRLKLDTKVDLKKTKFYYMDDDGSRYIRSVRTEARNAVLKAVKHFSEICQTKPKKVDLKDMQLGLEIWQAKFAVVKESPPFSESLKDGKGKVNPFTEFVRWLAGRSDHSLPAICLCFFQMLNYDPDAEVTKKMCSLGDKLERELDELLGDDGVLLYPGGIEPATYRHQQITRFRNARITTIYNILRVPITSVPMGLTDKGLPVGIQVVGRRYNDHLTLAVAAELEKIFGGWHSPSKIQ